MIARLRPSVLLVSCGCSGNCVLGKFRGWSVVHHRVNVLDGDPVDSVVVLHGAMRESNCVPIAESARENRQSALFSTKKGPVLRNEESLVQLFHAKDLTIRSRSRLNSELLRTDDRSPVQTSSLSQGSWGEWISSSGAVEGTSLGVGFGFVSPSIFAS
jgi:hypothetical protein